MFICLCSSVICLSAGKARMLNRGENRTRNLGVTSPHALPSELHGQPDFKTVITLEHKHINIFTA